MDFEAAVREHHLVACWVSEIACPNCRRVYVLTAEPLVATEVDCPSCGEHSSVVPKQVRAATSRPLPRTEIIGRVVPSWGWR